MNTVRNQIKSIISNGLPGIKAQLKLSTDLRNIATSKNTKTDAAVLILLYKDEQEVLSTVFMKRQAYKGHHSAQISFPGGKAESTDQSLMHTAIRESYEEIGINPNEVEIIGKLTELYIPVSGFLVHPYIGITQNTPTFKTDKTEVDYLITSPIQKLISHPISYKNREYNNKLYKIPYYNIKNEMLWGATAMILSEFIEILKQIPKVK